MYADLGHISPVSVRTEPGTNRLLLTAGLHRLSGRKAHCRAQQSCHRYALIAGNSSGFHQFSDPLSGLDGFPATAGASTGGMPGRKKRSTAAVSPAPRRALPNARRLIANAKHLSLGCSHAPLPAIRRRTSTMTADEPLPWATSRTSWDREPCFRHPMQVRTGPWPGSSSSATTCPTCLTLLAPDARIAQAIEAHRGARIPEVSPVTSSLAPRRRSTETATPKPRHRNGCTTTGSWRPLRPTRYRSANRSASRRVVRSGLLCRWPTTTGNPELPRGPSGWLRP